MFQGFRVIHENPLLYDNSESYRLVHRKPDTSATVCGGGEEGTLVVRRVEEDETKETEDSTAP